MPLMLQPRILVSLLIAFSLSLTALCVQPAAAQSAKPVAVTIIIDDIGNHRGLGVRAIALPGAVTYAVLPHSPYGAELARLAHARAKELMLHLPMDNDRGSPLGPGGLTSALDHASFDARVEQALQAVPHIRGVNNHMGSRLTRSAEHMQWLMAVLKRYPLYFVDSRTSPETQAERVAREHRIPTLKRDVFLDNDPDPAAIDRQFKQLLELAKIKGSAVAIGHPYPTTLGYLENALPKLDALGISLVSSSAMLQLRAEPSSHNTRLATHQAGAETSPPTPAINSANEPNHACQLSRQAEFIRVICG